MKSELEQKNNASKAKFDVNSSPLFCEAFNVIEAEKSVDFVNSKDEDLVEFKRSAYMILESLQSTVAKLTERVDEIAVAANNLEKYSY